jgi:hypothetical protein
MLKLASSIGLALAVADLKRRIRRGVRSGILGVFGAIFFVIALLFFLIAAHLWLSAVLNPIASAAIIGAVLLVIALVFFVLASSAVREPAKAHPVEDGGSQFGDALREGMARLGAAAGSGQSPLRNPIFQAAGLAIIAGFLLGRKSKRRKD